MRILPYEHVCLKETGKRLKKNTVRFVSLAMALAMVLSSGFVFTASADEELTPTCGHEEHKHDEKCYEKKLICELEETEESSATPTPEPTATPEPAPVHVHTDECYETVTNLICGLEESEGHTHGEECYDEEGNLICTLEESEGHTHDESCYSVEKVLVCGLSDEVPQEETAAETTETSESSEETVTAHKHTDECYEKVLKCDKEEHEHTLICYTNKSADLESQSNWESTLPGNLTGDWAKDLVTVARSQIGYRESKYNYEVEEAESEDGEDRALGYTRYGAWYGAPYADWCAMFVSFCLNYADIPSSAVPYEASAPRWVSTLTAKNMFESKGNYEPKYGDIIFFTYDGDGLADHVGIVESVKRDKKGNITEIKTIEGNSSDFVQENTYSPDDGSILGYGVLPRKCACYKTVKTAVCGQEQTGHVHSFDCYDEDGKLICKNTETTGHIHGYTCYSSEKVQQCRGEGKCKCKCHK